ncbi:MAG: serine/threonine-protein kinase [Nannocystaceae bacterium]|nr:serine/threonine-protein kinase [Nannocystaceae bacterium]
MHSALSTTDCPDEQSLVELAEGRAGDADRLRAHLDGCDDCRRTIAALVARGGRPHGLWAGRYRLVRLLGRGGMGEVHEAWDVNLERRVALKTLSTRVGRGDDPERRVQRLVRESKAMARVRHPNVVAVHDAGVWEGQVYVVMELVDGATLRAWCTARRRDWPELLAAFVAAAHGLQAAHARGIVHRDFKPDNVLVDGPGRVQVTDFGLAQWHDALSEEVATGEVPIAASDDRVRALDQSGSLTETGTAVGTPAYMAPEQFRGIELDARADVFAFCVALFEALAGVRPFHAESSRGFLLAQRAGADDAPLRARGVPRWLRAAVLAGLSFDRGGRPADMAAMLQRLQPPRPRRRGAVVAVAALAIGGGAWAWSRRAPLDPCRDTDPLAASWNDGARARLGEGAALVARFEGWASAWREAWQQACSATGVAAELQRACLTGQRAAFSAVLERAGELDVVAADRGLPRVQTCRDPDLAVTMPEPTDADRRAAVAAVRTELAEIDGLVAAGRSEGQEARAQAALARARALGFGPLEAEALASVAIIQDARGRPIEARATLLAAAQAAAASGHDIQAARAWTGLVVLESEQLHDHERGHEYAANARAAIERFAATAAAVPARLDVDFAEGMLWWDEGRNDEAIAALSRAEAAARASAPEALDDILEGTALVLEDSGEIEQAIAIHTELARTRELALGPEHPMVAISYANLSSSLWMAGRLEDALQYARRASALTLAAHGEQHPDHAMALHNEGELLRTAGRYEDAIALEQRARAIYQAVFGEQGVQVASCLMHEAGALQGLHRYDEAIAAMRRALELLDARDQWLEVAGTRANLADALRAAGEPARGLEEARAAAQVLQARAADRIETAYALQVWAECELALGHADVALPLAEPAAAGFDRLGGLPYDTALAHVVLARALLESRGGDEPAVRARARALLDAAAQTWSDAPGSWAERRAELARYRLDRGV